MRLVIMLALIVASAGSAAASGGLSCDVEDKAARISVESGVTRGMGSPVFNFRASVQVLDPAVSEDLRKTGFDGPVQYWLDNRNLRLVLYREREGDKPHGYVELTILTEAGDDDEGVYGGDYKLAVFDYATGTDQSWAFEGKIGCFVE